MKKPTIRKPWERHRTPTMGGGINPVDQSQAAATDVNNIVRLYHRTGELPPASRQGVFADITGLQGDLTERLIQSRETIRKFNADVQEHRDLKIAAKKAKAKQDREAAELERLDYNDRLAALESQLKNDQS